MKREELRIPFNAPLNELDTETQTYGCRQNNPDICKYNSLQDVCAFTSSDHVCKKPSRSWGKQFSKLAECRSSKVEKLMELYCPSGVMFKAIKDIAKVGTGSSDRKDAIDGGEYPFYVRSKYILKSDKYLFDETAIIIPGEGGVGDIFHFVEGKYDLHQRAYRIHFIDEGIHPKYAYYYFCNSFKRFILKQSVEATVTSIRKPMIEKFKVPVPPLEVQCEIVRILDIFTELTAELTTELTARRKQYEHYKNRMLTFDSQTKWTTLGEIGKVSMCKRIMKSETSTDGEVPFYKIGTFGKQANAYISRDTFEKYREKYSYPNKGDILISAAGTIGRTVIFDGEPAYFQDSNIVWVANDEQQVLNEFLYYWYQTSPWKVSSGGTIARLYNDNIAGAKVPVLPLKTQKQIVSMLRAFDAVCNDLNSGLPAEIEARQKQYEYYRDKLLTFKELSA